jgi:imidazolonepropionase
MQGNLIVENAAELVTCSGFTAKTGREMSDLGIIEDGAVVIEAGVIKYVGPTARLPVDIDRDEFDVINAAGKAVLPGFVTHTPILSSVATGLKSLPGA